MRGEVNLVPSLCLRSSFSDGQFVGTEANSRELGLQEKRAAHNRYRAEGHGKCCPNRTKTSLLVWVQDAGSNGKANAVVDTGPEEVELDTGKDLAGELGEDEDGTKIRGEEDELGAADGDI